MITYIDEIKKVTGKPIKCLIYSHHHYDHIAGGQPVKDAGAKIIAHKRAKERLEVIMDPATPLPKYENWPGYRNNLQFVLRRYGGLWGRGT